MVTLAAVVDLGVLIRREKQQFLVFAGLSAAVTGLADVARRLDPVAFRRFIGDASPVALAATAGVLGAVLWTVLLRGSGFTIHRPGRPAGLLWSSGLAALLALVAVLADLVIGFPADPNVRLPGSLLFYPVIAFVVEIAFHVLPLTLLVGVLTSLPAGANVRRIAWIAFAAVALLEPTLQVVLMAAPGRISPWAVAWVGLQVSLISLLQLEIFRRYDFLSMYGFRLVYCALWHVGWGHVRLSVLS